MKARSICINVEDITRLAKCLRHVLAHCEKDNAHIAALHDELNRADVLLPKQMPPNVVTMYSHVLTRDLDSGERKQYIVVFPEDTHAMEGRISVATPMGAAMLGRKAGDCIRCTIGGDTTRFRIERIYFQPEAAGMIDESITSSREDQQKVLSRCGGQSEVLLN